MPLDAAVSPDRLPPLTWLRAFAATARHLSFTRAAAAEMGIAVPEQLVVTGYDDISSSAYFKPPLTTIRQDTVLGGKLLAERIIDILAGARPDSATIPIELVVRASSKA